MKKILTTLSLAALASMLFAGPLPKALKARYDGIESAMKMRDAKTFSSFLANDFMMVDPKGKTSTKAEFIAQITPMFKSATKVMPMVKFLGTKSHDGMIDVMFDFHLSLMSKAGTTHIHEVGTDTWKMVAGKWLMIKTVDKTFEIKMPPMKQPKQLKKM